MDFSHFDRSYCSSVHLDDLSNFKTFKRKLNDTAARFVWKMGRQWIEHCLDHLFFLVSCAILIGYIEILKVWMFEDLNIWIYTAIFMGLLYYIFNGGFRVVTGFAFLEWFCRFGFFLHF